MDLQLYITKHYGLKYRSKGTQVKFAVVDKDKAKKYPQNFLCILPKKLNPKLKQKYKFTDLFGSRITCFFICKFLIILKFHQILFF